MKTTEPVKVADEKWLKLFSVNYTTPAGKDGRWVFASRKEKPSHGTDPLKADAVVIVPLYKDGRRRKLVVTKEFRIPIGDYEYGFPAGLFDENETVEEVAKRELKEETGLKMGRVLAVSPAMVSSAGMSDESVAMVFVECSGTPSRDGNDHAEDITTEILDYDQVVELRNSQNKISAKAWPILFMFECLGKIAVPGRARNAKSSQPKRRKSQKEVEHGTDGPATDPSTSNDKNPEAGNTEPAISAV